MVDADLSDYFGPSCGTDEVRRPSRKRWTNAGHGWKWRWKRTTAKAANAARTGRVGKGKALRKEHRSPLYSATSTCVVSFWAGRYWATLETSARRSSTGQRSARQSAGQQDAGGSRSTHEKVETADKRGEGLQVPEKPLEYLGYRIGRNYRRNTGRSYIGTRPNPASVQSISQRISEMTARKNGQLEPDEIVKRLNRVITGWGNYFVLGQVSPAYAAVDRHATRRLRQWLCRKHKVRKGKYARFPDKYLYEIGLTRLTPRTKSFPWAKA